MHSAKINAIGGMGSFSILEKTAVVPHRTAIVSEFCEMIAVLYYYSISQALRSEKGKLKENSATFSSSSLKYEASIKKMDFYERADKRFTNVYVANMTLT